MLLGQSTGSEFREKGGRRKEEGRTAKGEERVKAWERGKKVEVQ